MTFNSWICTFCLYLNQLLIINQSKSRSIMAQSRNDIQYLSPPPNYLQENHVTNTCSSKPSLAQIVSYIVVTAQIIVELTVLNRQFYHITFIILFVVTGIIMIISTFIASWIDPTDITVYKQKWKQYRKQKIQNNGRAYCQGCDSFCHQDSKHCKSCNRCVKKFDHHCIWINNCVGEANYKVFFAMIISTFLHINIFIAHAIYMSVLYSQVGTILNAGNVIVWIFMIIIIVFSFLLFNLILLHCYLSYNGLTTYEFLRAKRAEELAQQIKLRLKKKQSNNSTVQINIQKKSSNQVQNIGHDQFYPENNSVTVINDQKQSQEKKQESKQIQNKNHKSRYPKLLIKNPSLKMFMMGQAQSPSKKNIRKINP